MAFLIGLWPMRYMLPLGLLTLSLSGQAASSATGSACPGRPHVYIGAIKGANDLADPLNMPSLSASKDVGFYLTSYALGGVPGLPSNLSRIRNNFGSRYGLVEVGTNPASMPDIASAYGPQVNAGNNWTWGPDKGTTWPADLARAGWSPDIAMLNPFNMAATGPSDPYYKMNLLALEDVKKVSPGILHVLPYLTPNGRALKPEDHDLNWTDPAWQESLALAKAAGGLGLDTPANYFVHGREEAYRALVAQQIRWASQNGLVSVVLISPYVLGGAGSNGPDTNFLAAAQQEVAYLHGAGADPTVYVAANYAEAAAAVTPASETTPNSIAQVALWLARNAKTTPFPASWGACAAR